MFESTDSLQQSTEIVLEQLPAPVSVSMWPNTLAWDIVFLVVLCVFAVYLLKRYVNYVQSQWKREAISIAQQTRIKPVCEQTTQAWFSLIKRIHLVHNSKVSLLALTDEQLLNALPLLDETTKQTLIDSHYKQTCLLSEHDHEAIYQSLLTWLTRLPNKPTASMANAQESSKLTKERA